MRHPLYTRLNPFLIIAALSINEYAHGDDAPALYEYVCIVIKSKYWTIYMMVVVYMQDVDTLSRTAYEFSNNFIAYERCKKNL